MAILGGVSCAALVVPVLLNPTHFIEDDSYFYLQIARNILEGRGSTFDGLTPTNGYHPLWLWVCVGLLALAGPDTGRAVVVAAAACSLLFVGSILLVQRIVRAAGLRTGALAVGILALLLLASLGSVSEMALNAALHASALWALWRAGVRPDRLSRWLLGLALGAAMLARLDNVFFALATCGVLAFAGGPRRFLPSLRDAFLVGGVSTAVVLPALAWNLFRTGHLVPISGAIKSGFPLLQLEAIPEKLGPGGAAALVGAGLALALAPGSEPRLRRILLALGMGALGHLVYVVLFCKPGWTTHWSWYWVTGDLALAIAGCAALERLSSRALPTFRERPERLARSLSAALIAGALGIQCVTAWVVPGFSGRRPADEAPGLPWSLAAPRVEIVFARRLDALLAEGARWAVFDMPGILAFFSGRSVLALDGLTGSFEQQDELEREGVLGLLRRQGIDCFLGPTGRFQRPWIEARPVEGGILTLHRSGLRSHDVGRVFWPWKRLRVRSEELLQGRLDHPWAGVWPLEGGACPLRDPSPSSGDAGPRADARGQGSASRALAYSSSARRRASTL